MVVPVCSGVTAASPVPDVASVLQTSVEAPGKQQAGSGPNGTGAPAADGTAAVDTPEAVAGAAQSDEAAPKAGSPAEGEGKHPPRLLQLLAEQLGLDSPEEIVDFELNVCDTQPGTIGGAALWWQCLNVLDLMQLLSGL